MKPFPAVVLLCLVLACTLRVQGQASAVIGVPTYLASTYGLKCDGTTDDYAALSTLLTTITTSPNTGGTIVLPSTGKYCIIKSQLTWPGNVNIQGCGAVVNQSQSYAGSPGCGLDLQYTGASNGGYKVLMYAASQSYWRDLAIKTGAGNTDCNPFFFIGGTVVHFDNVSITGSNANASACNDAITLGVSGTTIGSNLCNTSPNQHNYLDCFYGYYSSFHHMYFADIKRAALFGAAANDTEWDYIALNDTNGYSSGSAFEFNGGSNANGMAAYGNRLSHIAAEQGKSGTNNYAFIVEILANATQNFIDWINASDSSLSSPPQAVVHIANGGPATAGNFVICGQYSNAQQCVKDDGPANYPNQWLDAFLKTLSIRNINAVNIGNSSIPVNTIIYGPSTVGGLPATPFTNQTILVSDGLNPYDCSIGGGTFKVLCLNTGGTTWKPANGGAVLYNTASASVNAGIAATTIYTTPSDGVNHLLRFVWAADLTVVGASCAAATTLTTNLIYQDPNAASAQAVAVQAGAALTTLANFNGILGNTPAQGTYMFVAKPNTAIQYSTAYFLGTSCSPGPKYQIYPTVQYVY